MHASGSFLPIDDNCLFVIKAVVSSVSKLHTQNLFDQSSSDKDDCPASKQKEKKN